MSRRRLLSVLCALWWGASLGWSVGGSIAQAQDQAAATPAARPNIVWFFVDDMSAHFSCYGEKTIDTPHVDRLAREGTLFRHAYVTAPVCSSCRSALITGMYQTSIGAHHHRSGRGAVKIQLPEPVTPVPLLFQQAGYYTCISGPPAPQPAFGKTDYNFEWPRRMYDGVDWSGRQEGQPFFAQIHTPGGKYREGGRWNDIARNQLGDTTSPESVLLPPYYPRDRVLLNDWARYLDTCRYTDLQVGQVVARLEREGLLDNTVLFFLTDHGISHARGKQFLYDEGLHVPLVIRGPGIAAGQVRDDLVEHIDLAATSLALAGSEVPAWMQGRNILAAEYQPREAAFAARDRCDETVEQLRSVRTARYKYIRNGHPERPHLQPNAYKDNKPILVRLRELHAAGELNELQQRLLFAPTRPREELYDLAADPHETVNLADNPAHQPTLAAMRQRLDEWIRSTGDQGQQPEPPAQLASDMAVYLQGLERNPARRAEVERNIAQMRAWAEAGK